MCGIAGIVGAPARSVLEAMLTALDHRGPDDRGLHVSDGAGLGIDAPGDHRSRRRRSSR